MQRFGFAIIVLQLLQAVTLFAHELRVRKVRLANLFVQVTAAFNSRISLTQSLIGLILVQVHILVCHRDILADSIVVIDLVHLVLDQSLLHLGHVLIVQLAVHDQLIVLPLSLLPHLQFEFGAHLQSLGLEPRRFLLVLVSPLAIVVLDGVVPFGIRHADHFAVVGVLDLLVDVEHEHVLHIRSEPTVLVVVWV